tara:strand:+ start:958 stop:1848 length:891 start_codon:yes stop_codon:yes gene_type:complete
MISKLGDSIIIFLKGMLMGIADLVPGISGGTIAFVTGIYEDLINALNNINLKIFEGDLINQFTKKKFDFLLILICGILFSILSFSKLLTYLLINFNIELRSFFLGLILVSISILYRSINKIRLFQIQNIFLLIFSIISSFMIFNMSSYEPKVTILYVFLCGGICSLAMILPGISGAYILIILGIYEFLINKISNLFQDINSIKIVCVFGFGFVIGIIFFSKFIKYLLLNFKKPTFLTLIGLIIGSLPKLLPIESRYDSSFFDSLTEFFYNNPSSIFFILIGIICVGIFSKLKIKIQ